jgi:hypothetical protein
LILAAVRGTVFTVTVAADGTSRVDTLEGQVATYGRQGEMTLTRPGQSAEVTARQYSTFLADKGVSAPSGDWRRVSENERQRVDNQTLAPIFSPNSDPLIAVLSNPNAAPNQGVQALAIENSAVEPGSIFASELDSSETGTPETRIIPASNDIDPQSTLLEEGLPDMIPLNVPAASRHGYVIGTFALPAALSTVFNKFIFDLNLDTGQISKSGFEMEYERSAFGTSYTGMWATGGTGSLDLNTLNFTISNFTSSYYIEADFQSEGTLGSGTTFIGSLSGPLDFTATANGQLTLDYVYDSSSFAQTTLPSNYNTLTGLLKDKPFYYIDGHFAAFSGATTYEADYGMAWNLNTGVLDDVRATYSFSVGANSGDIYLDGGVGSLSGSNFNVLFSNGHADSATVTYTSTITGVLQGNLASANPVVGTQVSGGGLTVSYGTPPPSFFPTTIPILDGQVEDPMQ